MSGPPSPLPPRRPRTAASSRRRVAVLVLLALAVTPATAAAGNRSVRLKTTFQGQQATAMLTVPDDWQGDATDDHVAFTAPSSRPGCDHVLRLRLDMLYVASTVTAPDWVTSRLAGNGPTIARGGTDYSWGVAARTGWRTSVGSGALVAGTGRFGRIMAELHASTDLRARCRTAQAPQAAKRLVRVLQAVVLQSAKRKR